MPTVGELETLQSSLEDLDAQFNYTMDLYDKILAKDLAKLPKGHETMVPRLEAFRSEANEMIDKLQKQIRDLCRSKTSD